MSRPSVAQVFFTKLCARSVGAFALLVLLCLELGCGGGDEVVNDGMGGDIGTGGTPSAACGADEFRVKEGDCRPWQVCGPGEFVGREGTSSRDRRCEVCGEGTFSNSKNVEHCEPCKSGTFSGERAVECRAWRDCPVGRYVKNVPDATEDRHCALCAEGTTTLRSNESSCRAPEECPAGTSFREEGASNPSCEPCAEGEFCPGGDESPRICADETWDHDADPATICAPKTNCVPGSRVVFPGDARRDRGCEECVDAYSTSVNAEVCTTHTTCRWGTSAVGTATRDATCAAAPRTIIAGYAHTCAIMQDKSVKCWGNGSDGQLGDAAVLESQRPRTVHGLTGADPASSAVSLAAGSAHTCALLEEGSVKCWGNGSDGQLGAGNLDSSAVPVAVVGLTGQNEATSAVALVAGGFHSCALLADASVRCWGWGERGQLGQGGFLNSAVPVAVQIPEHLSGAPFPVALAAGGTHTCALFDEGSAWCWGGNEHGQLGDGSALDSNVPVSVVGVTAADATTSVVVLAAGDAHTCAVFEDGAVRCWGWGENGQLGDGAGIDRVTPTLVSGWGSASVPHPSGLALGATHSCMLAGGRAWCWGSGGTGQLGNGETEDLSEPTAVLGFSGEGATRIRSLAASHAHVCALLEDDSVVCWGDNTSGQLGSGATRRSTVPIQVLGLGDAASTGAKTRAVALGFGHTCALIEEESVRCWGNAIDGQLGHGDTRLTTKPVFVSDLIVDDRGPKQLALGWNHACALAANDGVWCWGTGTSGQLGDGRDGSSALPVEVSGLTGNLGVHATALVAGALHSCALLEDKSVRCWGAGNSGQLGVGDGEGRSVPTPVVGLDGLSPEGRAVSLAAGAFHSCVITEDRRVRCWGENGAGQLGHVADSTSLTPELVPALTGGSAATRAVELALGGFHSCALLDNQRVSCWGQNNLGQLGGGGDSTANPTPVPGWTGTEPANRVQALAAGWNHTCALSLEGGVRCWGAGESGQLGGGVLVPTSGPTFVLGLEGGAGVGATRVATGYAHSCAILENGELRCWGRNDLGQVAGTPAIYPAPQAVVWE